MQLTRTLTIGVAVLVTAISAMAQEVTPISETTMGKIEFMSAAKDTSLTTVVKKNVKLTDKIFGTLEFPANMTNARVPAVVLMHGSSGIEGGTTLEWAAYLRQLGLATFVVDSFEPRGVTSTSTNQSLVTYTTSGLDALAALKVLLKHPRIDSNKIGVMGFSRGGVATQEAAFVSFNRAMMGEGQKFALHLSLYGSCALFGTTTGAPVFHFIGDKDGWANTALCTRYTETMRNAGQTNLHLTIYPGVRHGYDRKNQGSSLARGAEVGEDCDHGTNVDDVTYEIKGVKASVSELTAYRKECVKKTGSWAQGDSSAMADTKKQVTDAVSKYLLK